MLNFLFKNVYGLPLDYNPVSEFWVDKELINDVDSVDAPVEIVEIISVVDTNEIDCSFVDGIIEVNVSDDVVDQIRFLETIYKFGWVDFSVQIGKIISVVDTNEIDCSFVEGIIEINVWNDVDDDNLCCEHEWY